MIQLVGIAKKRSKMLEQHIRDLRVICKSHRLNAPRVCSPALLSVYWIFKRLYLITDPQDFRLDPILCLSYRPKNKLNKKSQSIIDTLGLYIVGCDSAYVSCPLLKESRSVIFYFNCFFERFYNL